MKRFVFVEIRDNINFIEMHVFCDSYTLAYGAVVYIRIVTSIGARVSLLASKTKVSPLKVLTIPRLELLGCVLLSKVCLAVGSRVDLSEIFCWTDSEVALCWVKGKTKCWKPWVENRVVRVRDVVKRERWNHVAESVNPADIPTQISSLDSLNDVWFGGPEFFVFP